MFILFSIIGLNGYRLMGRNIKLGLHKYVGFDHDEIPQFWESKQFEL